LLQSSKAEQAVEMQMSWHVDPRSVMAAKECAGGRGEVEEERKRKRRRKEVLTIPAVPGFAPQGLDVLVEEHQ